MKSILITGCSTGIGRAAARAFADLGYRVVATVRSPDDVHSLEQAGLNVVLMDMANASEVAVGMARALRLCNGRIDAVIHNAGVGFYGALEDQTRQSLEEQFQHNLFGVHQINSILIPIMRSQNFGRIVIVTSVLGFVSLPFRGCYAMTKYALEAHADTLRLELFGSGVQVSLVQPGPIETMFRENAYKAFMERIDHKNSIHNSRYVTFLEGLSAKKSSKMFALPVEAVLPALLDSVESRRPKVRYRVTVPTKLFSSLKRILPGRWLDWMLMRG